MMNIFFKAFLVSIVFWLTPLLIFFTTLSTQKDFTAKLKSNLAQSGIYNQLVTMLDDQVTEVFSEQKVKTTKDPLLNLIKQEITPQYIQIKTETLIDDTEKWTTGATTTPPVVSFQDVRDKLLTKYKKQYDQLVFLSKQLKTQQLAMQKEAKEPEPIASFDFEKFLTSEPIIPVGEQLGWIKESYNLMHKAAPIAWISLVGILGAILLFSPSLKSKLRWLGIACIVGGISSLIDFLVLKNGLDGSLANTLHISTNVPTVIKPMMDSLLTPLLLEFMETAKMAAIILFVAAFVLYGASFFITKSANRTTPRG